ncbi:derlin [Parastagonospora nodorum]|uniref:Derlin n=1 Tax=Phaeosphaeria nodorum (strain SN15 / ATCC MYA-4574 / FGSC 10173) TaxID=321614 RepID=A0A7U2FB69_PHANO|nr:derlin [Parastagonospora nodorum]QRD01029.1 derlin [Parastagonospora nodorum SN15]KAH3925394.1 derlin [Parastagonospora nodorum]KAH3940627.1 derlin [Parastagonospora nodorum]KAH3958240.1 derlin [Parastagonospora nodorum]
MANVLGGGDGMMGGFPLEQWFYEMPVCTRWWMTAALSASVLVQCRILSPFQLFYSVRTVFFKSQYWRLVTTFFYFGPLSLDLLYHIFFLQRYSRLLEESSGRSPAHFSWLLTFASTLLLCIAPMFSMAFLGSALSSTLIYIWSRKNPDTLLSFLGLLVFKAPYLPWVLLCFSLIMHGTVPKDEMCGIVVGHIWYYFNDIYPPLHEGHSPLDPPSWWIRLIEGRPVPVEEVTEETEATEHDNLDVPVDVAPVQ